MIAIAGHIPICKGWVCGATGIIDRASWSVIIVILIAAAARAWRSGILETQSDHYHSITYILKWTSGCINPAYCQQSGNSTPQINHQNPRDLRSYVFSFWSQEEHTAVNVDVVANVRKLYSLYILVYASKSWVVVYEWNIAETFERRPNFDTRASSSRANPPQQHIPGSFVPPRGANFFQDYSRRGVSLIIAPVFCYILTTGTRARLWLIVLNGG